MCEIIEVAGQQCTCLLLNADIYILKHFYNRHQPKSWRSVRLSPTHPHLKTLSFSNPSRRLVKVFIAKLIPRLQSQSMRSFICSTSSRSVGQRWMRHLQHSSKPYVGESIDVPRGLASFSTASTSKLESTESIFTPIVC